jgi:hypothetical protein
MANMNKLILIGITLLLNSCMDRGRDYIIRYKCVVKDNPNFATYEYFIGLADFNMIDSTSKFNIGDDVRMYSKTYGKATH